jgi:hypothetical protein
MANKGKMAEPRPIGFQGVSDNPSLRPESGSLSSSREEWWGDSPGPGGKEPLKRALFARGQP